MFVIYIVCRFLQRNVNNLFVGLYLQPRKLIGFVYSTLTNREVINDLNVYNHDPTGQSLIINFLVVDNNYRRKGLGKLLLKTYLSNIQNNSFNRVILFSNEHLVKYFEKFNFKLKSNSSFNQDLVEMSLDNLTNNVNNNNSNNNILNNISQSDLLAALSKPSTKPNNNLINFDGNYDFISTKSSPFPINSRNGRCPRLECKSLIFLSGAAELRKLETVHPVSFFFTIYMKIFILTITQLTLLKPNDNLSHPSLPSPHIDKAWRLPGPMSFENITFSKTAPQTPSTISKFLACGECEIGSLGWVDNSGCWIDLSRVLYE